MSRRRAPNPNDLGTELGKSRFRRADMYRTRVSHEQAADDVLEHWRTNPDHQVGLTIGDHRGRSIAGVHVETWFQFHEHVKRTGRETYYVPDRGGWTHGPVIGDRPAKRFRDHDTGAYTRLAWVPPPLPKAARYELDARGGEYREHVESRAEQGGWVLLVNRDGFTFPRKRKNVVAGITTLPAGAVIPLDGARRADGWSVRAAGPGLQPRTDGPAPWFVEALGLA